MKKTLIFIAILCLVAGGAYAWSRRKKSETGGLAQKFLEEARSRFIYKNLSPATQKEWAKSANELLPNTATSEEAKTAFLKKLLTIQKESLIGIYNQHWTLWGQQQNRDLVDLIKNSPGVKDSPAQQNTLKTLAKLIPTRKQQVKDLKPGVLSRTLPTNLPLS